MESITILVSIIVMTVGAAVAIAVPILLQRRRAVKNGRKA